jgi:hypothetical protein
MLGRAVPAAGDYRQSVGEHLSRHGDLGDLKGDVAPVANDLHTHLEPKRQTAVIARSPTTSASPDHDTAGRRRSRPCSGPAARTPMEAAIRPTSGDRSSRCARQPAYRNPCRSGPAHHPARLQLAVGGDRGAAELQQQTTGKIEPQSALICFTPSGPHFRLGFLPTT